MDDTCIAIAARDQADEDFLTDTLSDEALEDAASMAGTPTLSLIYFSACGPC